MKRTVSDLRMILERRRNRVQSEIAHLHAGGIGSPVLEEERDLCDLLDFLLEVATRKTR